MRRRAWIAAALLLVAGIPACNKPTALGNVNQILVIADPDLWREIEDDVLTALNPTSFTVRDESVFDVAYADPAVNEWANLSVNRQILVIGSPSYPQVAQALEEYDGTPPDPPAVFQVTNVWARNQLVTIALLPDDNAADAARTLLPRAGEIYLEQFETYARNRMFVTGPNTELADSLRRSAGFVLTLPLVYRHEVPEPGVHIFRNDQPDPSRLIRNITVASRPVGEVPLTAEAAAEWRATLAARHTQPPQMSEHHPDLQRELPGGAGIQTQGVWSNPPGQWPAAGMYITRLVPCSDRVFLIDAWLYAPGIPKYEYAFQLNTILDSFQCAEAAGAPA